MAQAKWLEKYLRMKPEVSRLFEDLEGYKDYCRMHMLKYDERDLYRSDQFRKYEKYRNWLSRQQDNRSHG
jgi:hypothetical protein